LSVMRFFVNKASKNMIIDNYLKSELKRAGYAGVEFQKTPLATGSSYTRSDRAWSSAGRAQPFASLLRPIESKYHLESPQIAVIPVQTPELNARIMAGRVASALERGIHFRRSAFIALRQISEAGARGAEIIIRGKLSTERSRYEKFRTGATLKAGQPRKYAMDTAVTHVQLKPGMFGIKVNIYLPVNTIDDIHVVEQAPKAAE